MSFLHVLTNQKHTTNVPYYYSQLIVASWTQYPKIGGRNVDSTQRERNAHMAMLLINIFITYNSLLIGNILKGMDWALGGSFIYKW